MQRVVARKTIKEYRVMPSGDGLWCRFCDISHYELRATKGWQKQGPVESFIETSKVRPTGWADERIVTFNPAT